MRGLVRDSLSRNGFELREAEHGAAAIALAGAARPDLVVLDWQMPGMSAPEVLTELKNLYADLPVVLLTAALSPRHARLAEIYGADAFLAKPFHPAELAETVESLLSRG